MATQILAPATAAGNSYKFEVSDNNPVTVFVTGLTGAETADLEFSVDRGTTWVAGFSDGAAQQFSTTSNMMTIYGPGTYRVSKGLTTAPVAVYIATSRNP